MSKCRMEIRVGECVFEVDAEGSKAWVDSRMKAALAVMPMLNSTASQKNLSSARAREEASDESE